MSPEQKPSGVGAWRRWPGPMYEPGWSRLCPCWAFFPVWSASFDRQDDLVSLRRRLRTRPLEMGVADVSAGGASAFPRGCLGTRHEATRRGQLLYPWDARKI